MISATMALLHVATGGWRLLRRDGIAVVALTTMTWINGSPAVRLLANSGAYRGSSCRASLMLLQYLSRDLRLSVWCTLSSVRITPLCHILGRSILIRAVFDKAGIHVVLLWDCYWLCLRKIFCIALCWNLVILVALHFIVNLVGPMRSIEDRLAHGSVSIRISCRDLQLFSAYIVNWVKSLIAVTYWSLADMWLAWITTTPASICLWDVWQPWVLISSCIINLNRRCSFLH